MRGKGHTLPNNLDILPLDLLNELNIIFLGIHHIAFHQQCRLFHFTEAERDFFFLHNEWRNETVHKFKITLRTLVPNARIYEFN